MSDEIKVDGYCGRRNYISQVMPEINSPLIEDIKFESL